MTLRFVIRSIIPGFNYILFQFVIKINYAKDSSWTKIGLVLKFQNQL